MAREIDGIATGLNLSLLEGLLVRSSMIDRNALVAHDWYAVFVEDKALCKDDTERVVEAFRQRGTTRLYTMRTDDPTDSEFGQSCVAVPNEVDALYAGGADIGRWFGIHTQVITDAEVGALVLIDFDDYLIHCGEREFVATASGYAIPRGRGRIFRVGTYFIDPEAKAYYDLDNVPDPLAEQGNVNDPSDEASSRNDRSDDAPP